MKKNKKKFMIDLMIERNHSLKVHSFHCISSRRQQTAGGAPWTVTLNKPKLEVDALGVITISRGCFERCGSNKKTPP